MIHRIQYLECIFVRPFSWSFFFILYSVLASYIDSIVHTPDIFRQNREEGSKGQNVCSRFKGFNFEVSSITCLTDLVIRMPEPGLVYNHPERNITKKKTKKQTNANIRGYNVHLHGPPNIYIVFCCNIYICLPVNDSG